MISVIIPLYNTGRYIGECLDSILAQSYGDYECIVVDDGSTDDGGRIADSFALRDSRFKIYHTDNRGVSAARNLGLEKARGEFVVFVDSDDTVENSYLASLINNYEKDIDLVVSGIRRFKDTETMAIFKPAHCVFIMDYRFVKQYAENICFFSGPTSKLYKKSVITQNDINFDLTLRLGEDLCFNIDYLAYTHKIVLIENVDYNYRTMDSSLTHRERYPLSELYHVWCYHKEFLISKKIWTQETKSRLYRQLGGYLYDAIFSASAMSILGHYISLLEGDDPKGCLYHFPYPVWIRALLSLRLTLPMWIAIKISRKRYGGIR